MVDGQAYSEVHLVKMHHRIGESAPQGIKGDRQGIEKEMTGFCSLDSKWRNKKQRK